MRFKCMQKVKAYRLCVSLSDTALDEKMHEEPQVPSLRSASHRGPRLKEGMVITIEPMLNIGTFRSRSWIQMDGLLVLWMGSLSAQYEHTIGDYGGWSSDFDQALSQKGCTCVSDDYHHMRVQPFFYYDLRTRFRLNFGSSIPSQHTSTQQAWPQA